MSGKTIKEVKVGDKVNSPKNGKGLVTTKTARIVRVTFENGNTVALTYKSNDAYFHETDF